MELLRAAEGQAVLVCVSTIRMREWDEYHAFEQVTYEVVQGRRVLKRFTDAPTASVVSSRQFARAMCRPVAGEQR